LPAKLYALPASHPCAAVELAMRLKGVDYERVELIPPLHKALQWWRFGGATVPGVVFDDGEHVLGSRAILRTLEHRAPDPPLLPVDARERREVEQAERWGDEVLQPLARRVTWAALRRRPALIMGYSEGADLPVPAPLARLSAPLVAHAASWYNDASDPEVRADLANLDFHLDRADRWLAEGVVGGGEAPNAGDLQIGSSLRLLLTLGDVARFGEGRPCEELARRWFPEWPGGVPAGVLPPEWLASAGR
jgi:glutathione S-transferase